MNARIVVAEDETDIRLNLKRMLTLEGFDVWAGENGHDALCRSIRDDVDISKDYVDIDAEPFSNLRHQRFRNFLGHILHPDQSLTFRQSHQKGVMVLFSYLAITHIKSAISAKTLGHSIRITTLPFRLRCR